MLFDIDQAVLNAFERWAHRFQRLTGRTNYWLAFHLTTAGAVVCMMVAIAGIKYTDTLLIVCGFLMSTLYLLLSLARSMTDYVRTMEEAAFKLLINGVSNPNKICSSKISTRLQYAGLTFGYIVFVGVMTSLGLSTKSIVGGLLLASWMAIATARLYFEACDPLPPSPGKIREWLNKLSFARMQPAKTPIK